METKSANEVRVLTTHNSKTKATLYTYVISFNNGKIFKKFHSSNQELPTFHQKNS
jgi:hypothetical protein